MDHPGLSGACCEAQAATDNEDALKLRLQDLATRVKQNGAAINGLIKEAADPEVALRAELAATRQELEQFIRARLDGIEGVEPQLRALLGALMDYAQQNPGVLKAAMTNVSVIASEAIAPSVTRGRKRRFCSSVPKSITGFVAWKFVAHIMPVEAHAFDISRTQAR